MEIVPELMRPSSTYGPVRYMGHQLIVVVAQRDPAGSLYVPSGDGKPKPLSSYSVDVIDLVERVRAGMERLGIAPG